MGKERELAKQIRGKSKPVLKEKEVEVPQAVVEDIKINTTKLPIEPSNKTKIKTGEIKENVRNDTKKRQVNGRGNKSTKEDQGKGVKTGRQSSTVPRKRGKGYVLGIPWW